jgi:hypothetical protein
MIALEGPRRLQVSHSSSFLTLIKLIGIFVRYDVNEMQIRHQSPGETCSQL